MLGKTLIHYEISGELGRGGMGEVYQAKDTKLGRDVAIKVLPEEFALDKDRVARFQREAKLLASLNHPNIAAIYGLEESEGIHFLVMELIEGDTLRDRIKSGPIPVEEALKLALQMAEALEAAHEKGVIHRDLKPANIKVTPDGKVKILDFGLAKAYTGDQGNVSMADSPTISAAATQQGVILGTAAYMSPEQAKGKPVDKRADIWAFGVVLFEMLTGQTAFQGEDVSETLASVIKGDSNLTLLPTNIHPRVREVITRCLQKDMRKRYSGIGDARYEIEQALSDPSGVIVQPGLTAKPKKKLQAGIPLVSAIAILCLIVAGVAVWYMKPIEPHGITRFSHELPEGQEFEDLYNLVLEVSPDGRQIVYRTNEGLYVRSVDQLDARLLPGTQGAQKPFFSPDGQWIGFLSTEDNQLKKIAISGGAPVKLTGVTSLGSFSWGKDDWIVYGEPGIGIMRVSSNGGTPEVIVEESESIINPKILPDEMSVLFINVTDYPRMVTVQSLETGERKELVEGHDAQYLSTGHLVYELDNSIFAVPFDLDRLALTGGPIPIIQGVSRPSGAPQYAVSDSGTLVYVPGTTGDSPRLRTLVWVDRSGKEQAIDAEPRAYVYAHLSPNTTRVALDIRDQNNDIWIWDLDRKTLNRLTSDLGTDYGGLWTPDGTKVVYMGDRDEGSNIYQRSADGSGSPELLATTQGFGFPEAFSPDGEYLLIGGRSASEDIHLLSIGAGEAPKPLLASKFNEYNASISPDGRWMAYQSDRSGHFEIYVRPFPDVNALLYQISTEGGQRPLWNENGRELFYFLPPGTMMSVPIIETSPSFKAGTPKVLFKGEYHYVNKRTQYSVTPDGRRFLMIKPAGARASSAPPRQINVVLNWLEELKERVPVD